MQIGSSRIRYLPVAHVAIRLMRRHESAVDVLAMWMATYDGPREACARMSSPRGRPWSGSGGLVVLNHRQPPRVCRVGCRRAWWRQIQACTKLSVQPGEAEKTAGRRALDRIRKLSSAAVVRCDGSYAAIDCSWAASHGGRRTGHGHGEDAQTLRYPNHRPGGAAGRRQRLPIASRPWCPPTGSSSHGPAADGVMPRSLQGLCSL